MDKQNQLDELFQTARDQKSVYTFGDAKQAFLSSIPSKSLDSKAKKSSFYSLNNWIIMIITTSSFIIALILFSSKDKNHVAKEKPTVQSVKSKSQQTHHNYFSSIPESKKENSEFEPFERYEAIIDSLQNEPTKTPLIYGENQPVTNPKNSPPILLDEYPFPKLTEKEIAANNKKKKEMLKSLEKFDKKGYVIITSGSFDYNGELISVQSFLIQKTEVSNLEYRTFLFDLLIQGRKDEFLMAKPDQKQWSILANQELNPYEEHYFSHPAYDNYPVVNVSREGAEMYCKWLTQELVKVVDEKKRNQYNDIRLPFREEWVMAASIEGKKGPYPWDGQFTRNSEGVFLANYRMTQEENRIRDSIANNNNVDLTAPVNSYYPNAYGLYNMSGNVAEMVYDNYLAKLPGTAGGGWINTAEQIKILAPDAYSGITTAKPYIGFRVVMTYLGSTTNR